MIEKLSNIKLTTVEINFSWFIIAGADCDVTVFFIPFLSFCGLIPPVTLSVCSETLN